MPRQLIKRFFEIIKEEGLNSALRSTGNYILYKTGMRDWWRRIQLWKLRLKSGGKNSIIRDINGSKMELDIRASSPNKLEQALAVNGVREPGATRLFQKVLKDLESRFTRTIHVFDIGANVGYFALMEAHILGERGQIYAIEADPENAARLKNNIRINEYPNIEVLQIGVGDKKDELELAKRSSSNLHMMKEIIGERDVVDTVEVKVRPLDDMIATKKIPENELIMIRMDIEGYEGHAFRGMDEFLSSNRPAFIFVEIHPSREGVDPEQIANKLIESGFSAEYISFDGGDNYQRMDSMDKIHEIDSNSHIMVSRF